MNEQPPVVFGYIIALGLFYVFLYYFYQAKENASKSTCSYDPTITIGYIVDDEPAYDQSFYEDCRDALVSIGYKKSNANTITKQVFSKSVPDNITSFLSEAMKLK